MKRSAALILLAATLSPAAAAAAEPRDPVRADALFRQGQALLTKGDVAGACQKLADSYALDATLGTLLNLAYCHERQQRFFTAWVEYTTAESHAARTEQRDRAAFARGRAADLARRLPRARLEVQGARAIYVDGQRVERAAGDLLVVPSGEHTIAIDTDAGERRSATVTFPAEPGSVTAVAFLEARSPAPVAGTLASTATQPPQDPPRTDGGEGRRTAGFVVGAAGLAALGVGSYFGIATLAKKDDAARGCDATGCDRDAKHAGDLAHTYATLSTVLFVAGGVAAAAGATLVLTAPSGSPAIARSGFVTTVSPAGFAGTF